MTRAQALTELVKFTPLATAVGISLLDNDANIGPALDSALRALGYAEDELAAANTTADESAAYLALIDYHTLDLMSIRAITHVDIEIGSAQSHAKKRSQLFDHILKLKAEALSKAKGLGYLGSDFVLGEISVNYLETLSDSEL